MATIPSLFHKNYLLLAAAVLLKVPPSHAQNTSDVNPHTPVIQVQSRLIVVDVTVEDADGNPVPGLKRNNFVVEEDDAPQRLRTFEDHVASSAQAAGPQPPELAPGSFTNYTPLPPAETLNVLLLDTLNTPLKDQVNLRAQLRNTSATLRARSPWRSLR